MQHQDAQPGSSYGDHDGRVVAEPLKQQLGSDPSGATTIVTGGSTTRGK